ncbi:phytoene desaturase family protein, partial [Gordonia soli]
MSSALVVGSGPNGLTAAVVLAEAGLDVTVVEAAPTIGGGTRTSELIEEGVWHDHCSAFHPLGAGSPYWNSIDLEQHGLRWLTPEIDCVHPLDDGSAGVLHTSIDETAAGLGADGARWKAVFGHAAASFDQLATDILGPMISIPRHPLALIDFGPRALAPASLTAAALRTPQARALFGGIAAHAFGRLSRLGTSAPGLMMIAAGHRHGWPVAEGGSSAITAALAAKLIALGGQIETDLKVDHLDEVADADVVMMDVTPRAALEILGDRLPTRIRRAYLRHRYGTGAFKVDYVIDGEVPWTNPDARRAGTVHLGGEFAQVAAAEKATLRGSLPSQPFVLVGQQYLADPGRSNGDHNPLWAYAHVPHRYSGDATEVVTAQIERFAPGFRRQIVASRSSGAAELERENPNYIGGDIGGGANDLAQLIARP